MNSRPVILLSSATPGALGVGGQVLADLMQDAEQLKIVVSVEEPFLMGTVFSRAPFLNRIFKASFARIGRAQEWRLRWFRKRIMRRRIDAITAAADALESRCVWLTTSTPELIWIGEQLGRKGFDLRVMIWDDPRYLMQNLRLPYRSRTALWESFTTLLQMSSRTAVVTQSMREEYSRWLKEEPLIIRHGVRVEKPAENDRATEGPVRMIFAGSLYSKMEWNALVGALESVHWNVGGRAVELSFMGVFPLKGATRTSNIVMLGHQPFDRAMDILAQMDIGYLPYWFDKEHEIVARTSFPGKISSYAAAGLAVFHHAPAYTEVSRFLDNYPFGVTCASLEADSILARLAELIKVSSTTDCRDARCAAVKNELSADAMAPRLAEFLTIEHKTKIYNDKL